MRNLLAYVLIWYIKAGLTYQYDTPCAFEYRANEFGDHIFFKVVPVIVDIDNLYVSFQPFIAHITATQQLAIINAGPQNMYNHLLKILGYEFLSKFTDLEMISLYRQASDNNMALSLDSLKPFLLSCRSTETCPMFFNLLIFTTVKLQTSVLFRDKTEKAVKNLVYTENVRSNFINFYLKGLRTNMFNLKYIFKLKKKWKKC